MAPVRTTGAIVAAAAISLAVLSYLFSSKKPNLAHLKKKKKKPRNKVTIGVMYTREEAEGQRLKNPFDTITEGIGINRLTQNFMMAKLDGAFRGTDLEAFEMSR